MSELTLGRYIEASHGKGNAPSTIAQNLSAIYESAVRLGEAVEPTVKLWAGLCVKGAYNLRAQQVGPPPLRGLTPPEVVLGIARSLVDSISSRNSVDDPLIRAQGLVVITFLFCLRADSVCAVQREHVVVSPADVTLMVTKFKGRTAQYTKELVVPLSAVLAQAVRTYVQWWDSLGAPPTSSLFGFMPSRGEPSKFLTASLRLALPTSGCLGALRAQASLTSHSLRRGAAVCLYALRVPEHVIMEWAGWKSLNSMSPYIRGRVFLTPTEFDFRSFGWLLRS